MKGEMDVTVPNIRNSHDPETRNIINRSIDVTNELVKRFQDLVAEGQLTPEQYATLIQTVNGMISKGEVKLDDLSEDVLNALKEADPTFNLLSIPRKGSVTPDTTTFLDKTKNVFDGVYQSYVLRLDASNNMRVHKTFSGEQGSIAIVPVNGSTTYTVKSHDIENTDVFRIGLSNRPLEFSAYDLMQLETNVVYGDVTVPERQYTFTTENDSKYAYIQVSKTSKRPRLQIQVGSKAEEYVAPYTLPEYISTEKSLGVGSVEGKRLKDKSVTPVKTSFFDKSRNLFDGEFYDFSIENFGSGDDVIALLRRNFLGENNSIIVPVQSGKTYTIKIHDYENSNQFTVATGDSMPVYDNRGIYETDRPAEILRITHPSRLYTIKIPSGHKYLYVLTGRDQSPPKYIQVEEGTEQTDYVNTMTLKQEYIDIDVSKSGTSASNIKVLAHQDFYDVPELEEVNSGTGEHHVHQKKSADMYALYNVLMAQYPDYISRELAGREDTGLPIYKYKFEPTTPEVLRTEVNTELLHFFITGGIHGSEKAGWWCLYETMKQICENWKDSNALSKLRWDVKFTVIPIANPYGVDNPNDPKTFNGKINSKGIDVYRNFPAGFTSGTLGTVGYSGAAPLTEPEAIIISNILKNEEVDFYLDIHNFSSQPDPNTFLWLLSNEKFGVNMSQKYLSQITQKWKIDDSTFPQEDSAFFGYVSGSAGGNTLMYAESLGIPSGIFEISHTMHPKGDPNQYSSEVITRGVEGQLNWLYMAYINLINS